MKFTKHLETHKNPEWKDKYIRYQELTELLKVAALAGDEGYKPSMLSLTSGPRSGHSFISRNIDAFFIMLEADVKMVEEFASSLTAALRTSLGSLSAATMSADITDPQQVQQLLQRATALGDRYLGVEGYINLNYAILKRVVRRHDKLLPSTASATHFFQHVGRMPWVRGEHQDLQVTLAKVFNHLHRAPGHHSLVSAEDAAQKCTQSFSQTFWVRHDNLAAVVHTLLQHLIMQSEPPTSDGSQHMHCLYLDNSPLALYHTMLYGRPYASTLSLSWRGNTPPSEVSVSYQVFEERWCNAAHSFEPFTLPASKVSQFLLGRWSWHEAGHDIMSALPQKDGSVTLAREYAMFRAFTEAQRAVETKHLQPVIAVSKRQRVFGSPQGNNILVTVEDDMRMELQYTTDGRQRLEGGIWLTSPAGDHIHFPYAVVKVQGRWPTDAGVPHWLYKLMISEDLIEVHDFSEYIHGCAGLLPDMVRCVPYWVDDPDIQDSLYAGPPSSPTPEAITEAAPCESLRRRTLEDVDEEAEEEEEEERSHTPGHRYEPPTGSSSTWGADGSTHGKQHDHQHPTGSHVNRSSSSSSMQMLEAGSASCRHRMWGRVEVVRENGVLVAGALRPTGSLKRNDSLKKSKKLPSLEHTVSMPARLNSLGLPPHAPRAVDYSHVPTAAQEHPLIHLLTWHMGMGGWQAKLLQRIINRGKIYRPQLEPELVMNAERMFVDWMRLVVTVGGLALGMLGFAAKAPTDPDMFGRLHMAEITGFTLLISAIVLCVYNLFLFIWRSSRMDQRKPGRYDDFVGLVLLQGVALLFMVTLFILNIIDFAEMLRNPPDDHSRRV